MLKVQKKYYKCLDKIFSLLRDEFPDAKLILFGSITSGKEVHDIDIGIEDKKRVSIFKLQRIKEKIDDLNIPYKIDLVDFKRVTRQFYNIAARNLIIWKN